MTKKKQERVSGQDWTNIWELNCAKKHDEFWWKDCIMDLNDEWMEEVFDVVQTTDLFTNKTVKVECKFLDPNDEWMEEVFEFLKTTNLFV